jgi:protein with PEP-CTERM/exosortase system signal
MAMDAFFSWHSACSLAYDMKMKTLPATKLAFLLCTAVIGALLMFSDTASAGPNPGGGPVGVPDGGITAVLLGTALGALGVARRYLRR